ncbi:hypothetical protein X769_31830 [Mesorhizobium sp. LSJC268A00]|nr:hypothetical protein X769_31830 [Mesorhizobium sp. LSJC268A00]
MGTVAHHPLDQDGGVGAGLGCRRIKFAGLVLA